MTKHRVAKLSVLLLMWVAAALGASAQTFTTLAAFNGGSTGISPQMGVIQGTDGNLYGVTSGGFNIGLYGSVFRLNPSTQELTTLYTFCPGATCSDGQDPQSALVQATNLGLYGTTAYGGATDAGTLFEITPAGAHVIVHNFCSIQDCPDGAHPQGVILGSDGNFYGTTSDGGASGFYGSIFKVTPTGVLTTLHSFCTVISCPDGSQPVAALLEANNGNYYGTTPVGGTEGGCGGDTCGTIFEVTPGGAFTDLYSFSGGSDGAMPQGALLQGPDGNLYGTTSAGGANCKVTAVGCGTIFKLTPGGKLITLYTFCSQTNCPDGNGPYAGLTLGSDGNFYGTTLYGGANAGEGSYGAGTIFKITPGGQLTTLYSFCAQTGCSDGTTPFGALLQATNGTFYGTNVYGGYDRGTCKLFGGCGTLFSLSLGLEPFVKAQPNFGRAGRTIYILGNDLTGTTSVTFNGTTASFQVLSSTYIKASVPTGATPGTIVVTTPNGTLSSNVAFRVTQ